jgi:hypothetical protein
MRTELSAATLLIGALCIGATPAKAVFQPTLGIAAKTEVGRVREVNGQRHYHRGYGYPYYGYRYRCLPPPYGQYPLVYPEYVRGVPFRCCRPYYAPYY